MGYVRLIAAGAALAVAALAGWTANGLLLQAEIAQIQKAYAEAQAQAHASAQKDEALRFLRLQKVQDAETQRTQAQVADRAAAVASGNGLRFATDARAQAALDSAVAGECAAAADATRVFANVLKSMEQRGGRMAQVADDRGNAGETCEGWADALNSK